MSTCTDCYYIYGSFTFSLRLNSLFRASISAAQLDGVEGVPPNPGPICQNGDVFLGYGSTAFIGLGFSVMVMLVFIEVSQMAEKQVLVVRL